MVYITQPTEYGTVYSLAELTALSEVCRRWGAPLYVDGARLFYALGSVSNDVTVSDLLVSPTFSISAGPSAVCSSARRLCSPRRAPCRGSSR